MKTLHDVQNVLRAHKSDLGDKFSVRRFGVFGSVALGEETTTSDVDILVEFLRPVSMFTFIKLEQHLTNLLGAQVDLVTPDALKSVIRDDVLKNTHYV